MNNPAIPGDLTGDVSVTEERAQRWLDRVWRALNREIPDLSARLDAGDEDGLADLARDVTVSATLRVLRNAEGAKKRGVGVDDWNESVELDDASQDIYFTSAELRRLAKHDDSGGATSLPFAGSIPYC